MNKLRPKLIIAKSKGGRSRFKLFLILLFIFALGVFVGAKIKNIDIEAVKKEVKIGNSKTHVQREAGVDNSEMHVRENQKLYSKEDHLSTTQVAADPIKDAEESKPLNEPELYKADKYTLQVGAFKDEERAQRVVNELKEKGYYAYILPKYNSRGGVLNLIKVGKFETKEEAQDFAALFQKKENMEAIVEELSQQ